MKALDMARKPPGHTHREGWVSEMQAEGQAFSSGVGEHSGADGVEVAVLVGETGRCGSRDGIVDGGE